MKERIPDMNLSGMLFSPFSSGHCVLHFIDCDYPFDIFKLFLDVNVSSSTKCKIKINKHLILIKIVFCDIGKTKHHIHIYFTNGGSNYLSVPTQTHILISTSFKQTVIFGADVDK